MFHRSVASLFPLLPHWCNGEGVTKGREICAETRRPAGKTVLRLEPVPEAIDEFIEELFGLPGIMLHREPGLRDGSANEGMLLGVLLVQAKVNCAQAETNLQQAKANEETLPQLRHEYPEHIWKGGHH